MAASDVVAIKSKFELEFRRISLPRRQAECLSLAAFHRLVCDTHCLSQPAPVQIFYLDPRSRRLAAIEGPEALAAALGGAAPLLRLFVSRVRGTEVEVS